MKTKSSHVFRAIIASFLVCTSFHALEGAQPVRLLFAGSSSTYWNDLPDAVARMVDGEVHGHEGHPAVAELVGRSGDDIRVYLDPGFNRYQYGVRPGQTFLEKVRDEPFDFVSLMVVCRFITCEDDGKISHADAVTQYCEAIRNAGAEPVFYEMGWGRSEQEAEGRRLILELAKRNGIKFFAPCSSAWARVYREWPGLQLQHPNDSTHPGDLGHFLNLACFYSALTRSNPVGQLPRNYAVWPHFTREEKEAREAELDARYAEFQPNPYQARLPDWMQRSSAAVDPVTIDDATARYLETIAWETWREIDVILQAN